MALISRFKLVLIILLIAITGLGAGAFFAAQRTDTPNLAQSSPAGTVSVEPVADATASAGPKVVPIASASSSPRVSAKPSPTKQPFVWSVTIRPFLYHEMDKNRAFLPAQMDLAKELGVTSVRVDYSDKQPWMNDLVLAEAKKRGIEVIFILPLGPNDTRTDPKLYDNAYRYVYNIVKKYKDQVKVWQLGTEVATVALKKPDMQGISTVDYPKETYTHVATWLMAATRAVKDADPEARRMLNDQWIHVGFFKKFIAEGGQFEIIGWNWFSDMGGSSRVEQLLVNNDPKQKFRLMDTLKSFNKEIWFAEVNRRQGSLDGNEKAQDAFLKEMGQYAVKNKSVHGFIVFLLIGEEGYSLVHPNLEGMTIRAKKPVFTTYQQLIRQRTD